MSIEVLSLATLDQFVGQELGVTEWVRLGQERIDDSRTAQVTINGSTSYGLDRVRFLARP